MKTSIGALVAVSALCGFVVAGAARAKNSLMFSAADYPASNWEPYHQRLGSVREAVGRGDNKAVKREIGQWFTMLRHRDHGISNVGADELYDCSLMVTPIQEYGIAVPAGPVGLAETGYSH